MDIITFIIPTVGRNTLINSINSLLNQTITLWKAIIIFDGIPSNFKISDERVTIIQSEKLGENINSAGNVRNYGITFAKTKWIAFLDDDDEIANDYIEIFYRELKILPDLDVLIFRMKQEDRIIPKLKIDNFYICDVGISFVMKKSIYDKGLKFIPNSAEDFLYLDQIRNKKYKIVISPYIKYFVKGNIDSSLKEKGNRVLINYNNITFLLFIGYKTLFLEKLK